MYSELIINDRYNIRYYSEILNRQLNYVIQLYDKLLDDVVESAEAQTRTGMLDVVELYRLRALGYQDKCTNCEQRDTLMLVQDTVVYECYHCGELLKVEGL